MEPAVRELLPRVPLDEWLRPAAALPLGEVLVEVTLGRARRLSSPLASLVRGLFGERLRAMRCLTGARDCAGCPVSADCDYARIFDGDTMHPFWLQGVPSEQVLRPGRSFLAQLRVARPALGALPLLDTALRDALRAIDPEVRLGPSRRAVHALGELMPPAPPLPLRLVAQTPLSLRGDLDLCGALCPAAPWLALLVRAGVRRLDLLVRAFAPPPGGRLPRAALPDLREVRVLEGGLRPWSGSRFSHRQKQRLPLAGLQGAALLDGPAIATLLPLLRALVVTSVGKATTLGLGTLRVG